MSLINPTNKREFIEHVKYRIGYPVTKLNLHEFQYEIRVQEALKLFSQYHYQALEHVWVAHQITAPEAAAMSITTPEHVKYVVQVQTTTGTFQGATLIDSNSSYVWSNPLWSTGGQSKFDTAQSPMMSIFLLKNYISNFENTMYAQSRFHWNEHTRKLQIDSSWRSNLAAGKYIVYEAYSTLEHLNAEDPDYAASFWSNDWLIRYTEQLFLLQWGTNLGKFEQITLPGGHVLRASQIKSEAEAKLEALKTELVSNYMQWQQIYTA